MFLFKLLSWYILLLYYISLVSSQSSVKSSVSYNRHNNLSDILQTIVSDHKDVDVITISRREPDGNSTQLFQQLHKSWYDDYNVTFLSFDESKIRYNMTCYELAANADEMHTGRASGLVFVAKLERHVHDPDSERVKTENDDVCYPKTNPIHPLWRRAVHVVIEPMVSDENVNRSSVLKVGRKFVELKSYSDILLIWAHTEHFLKNVTFMSAMGNFTYKIGLLQEYANATIFSYCLFCNGGHALLAKISNFKDLQLEDTSANLHGIYLPGMSGTAGINNAESNCNKSLEKSYEVTLLCVISKRLNFTWTVELSLNPSHLYELLGKPNAILYISVTNLPLAGTPGEPYRMSFTRPWETAHFTFVHRKPRTIFYWYNFILPFTRESWIYTVCSLFATALLATIIANECTGRSYRKLLKKILRTIFVLTSMQLNQCPSPPLKQSLKIITTMWLLHCMVINTGYTTKLYSFLTSPLKETVIPKNFQELHDSMYFNPGGSDITFSIFVELLSDPKMIDKNEILQKIVRDKKRFIKTESLLDCLNLIRKGINIACVDSDDYLIRVGGRLSLRGDENFFEFANDTKEMFFISMGFWRESPQFPHVDKIVQKLLESGLMKKYTRDDPKQVARTLNRRRQILTHKKSLNDFNFKAELRKHYAELGVRVLRFGQIRGIFYGFLISLLLTTLCCIIEMYN